jgi:hypothetical protein
VHYPTNPLDHCFVNPLSIKTSENEKKEENESFVISDLFFFIFASMSRKKIFSVYALIQEFLAALCIINGL